MRRHALAHLSVCVFIGAVCAMHGVGNGSNKVVEGCKEIMRYLCGCVASVYRVAVRMPLMHVYIHSLGVGSFGGWAGATNEHICASLASGSNPHYWTAHAHSIEECARMVDARLDSILVTVGFVSLLFIILRIALTCVNHLTLVRPIVMELRAMNTRLLHGHKEA